MNHENKEIEYCLEVVANGAKLCEVSQIQLSPNVKWEKTIGFAIQEIGSKQKVEFRLYKAGEQLSETRYLWVNVRA